jgi:hypothetical protein
VPEQPWPALKSSLSEGFPRKMTLNQPLSYMGREPMT